MLGRRLLYPRYGQLNFPTCGRALGIPHLASAMDKPVDGLVGSRLLCPRLLDASLQPEALRLPNSLRKLTRRN